MLNAQQGQRRFDSLFERGKQFGAGRAVDGAMIAGKRRAKQRRRNDLAVVNDRPRLARTDREDRRLRRVDDRGKFLDPEHAKIGDGADTALIFLGFSRRCFARAA